MDIPIDPIDDQLIEEILLGNCVAFVGAGFAAPAVPNWDDLLRRISDKDEVGEETKKRVQAEPVLASFFHSTILEHDSFSSAVADLIANDLGSSSV